MKKLLNILALSMLFVLVYAKNVDAAEQRSLYQDVNHQTAYLELWEVTPENVENLNLNFLQILVKSGVKTPEKITLEYLNELKLLANKNASGDLYQGYANLYNLGEGYVFGVSIEDLNNGNKRVRGFFIKLNGSFISPIDIEVKNSNYHKILAESMEDINEGSSSDEDSNSSGNSSGNSSSTSPEPPAPPTPPTPPEPPTPPTPPEPPTPPGGGDSGIGDPDPGNIIPGPTTE